ncbi:MAG: response regulator transcription factor [Eubacteriales bacterium]|nr:response regulator transcription factor [Eubacteriales bacterium]
MKILIVEDSFEINNLVKECLSAEYDCRQAFSGIEAASILANEDFDLIILDLMLPGLAGEDLIIRNRQLKNIPTLVISAKASLNSRVDCLKLGADDYLVKPFDLAELEARVEALLRRRNPQPAPTIEYGDFSINRDIYDCLYKGQALGLTKQEFKILEVMLRRPDKVFTKEEIYNEAWDDYYIGDDKTINVHISNLRRKCKQINAPGIIETVWGIGFKLRQIESLS